METNQYTDFFRFHHSFAEYITDASQRTVLYFDVMRRRGNQYIKQMEEADPNVLQFEYELIESGKYLPEPVNYYLAKIIPPEDVVVNEVKRPFVVIDPRAGQGPGIGGFKKDSEVGDALRTGHPCYFIGFLSMPEPGQTIESIMKAESFFLERVSERHPKAEGKPVVIGNCQAGWAVMMLAAAHPHLCGPLILAGAPLSYWGGVRGIYPMRYSGGLLGGSWLTALTGDMGNGKFDGSWLVQNFENQKPANTLWTKQYNLYSRVDTEAPRYLDFEWWWNDLVVLNAEEMQYIVDNLFIGNKLSTGQFITQDGTNVDIRNVRSPIICLCSKGDNITPVQQALGWITDLYDSVKDIQGFGQTIVYAVHEKSGHLGLFVSGSVAKKEYMEFATNIDFIDCLPPGLYEAVIEDKKPDSVNPELIGSDYISRFESRTLDDIRAMGNNSPEEERCFAAVKRTSEITHGLYKSILQPAVRAMANDQTAEWLRKIHPLRLGYEGFSDRNPLMKPFAILSDKAKENRQPVDPDNIFWKWQGMFSDYMVEYLEMFKKITESTSEQMFFAIYGNPFLQAFLGMNDSDEPPRPRPSHNPLHAAHVKRRIEELKRKMDKGGPNEAMIRAILYVRMPENAPDERTFEMLNRICKKCAPDLTLTELKDLIREQVFMIVIDEKRALETIADLLKGHEKHGAEMLELVRKTVTAKGKLSNPLEKRFEAVATYFVNKGTKR